MKSAFFRLLHFVFSLSFGEGQNPAKRGQGEALPCALPHPAPLQRRGSPWFFLLGNLLLWLFLILCVQTHAQQTPLFSAYHFNKFSINPAFTGIDNQYRAFGFYRSQWADMPGRPITGGFTIEGSFWKDQIGAGIFVLNDRIGIFNQTNASFSYAQKIKLAEHHQISLGLQGAAFVNQIDFSNALAVDINDPSVAGQELSKAVFDLNAGISYKWKNLLLGFCVPQVLQPNAEYTDAPSQPASYTYVRHYNALAQYKISLAKEKFNITPTLLMRKGAHTDFQFDATLLLDYKNTVFAGAGYRNYFGVITMAGINVLDMFTVAYAFDFTTQETLKGNVGNTHEVVFGFHLPSDYKKKQKQEDVLGPTKTDLQLDDLRQANDSLTNELSDVKQEVDSLSQVLKSLSEELKQKEADSLKQVVSKLFTTQPAGDDDKTESPSYSLDKIYFDRSSDTLREESKEQLDLLVNFLEQFPEVEIMIKGYADSTGSDELNRSLSEDRARAVADYLEEHGISKKRITHKGYGKENPIADNNTVAGRKMNRRVEFTITKQ